MKHVLQTTRWSLTLLVLTALALVDGQSAPPPQAEDTTMTHNSKTISTQTIDTSAPVISRHDILIDAPLEHVWAIQTDVTRWTTWLRDVDAMTLEDSLPLEPGSVFRWETQGLDITSTVTQVDAPHRIVWGGPAQGIVAVHVWTFTDTPQGVRVHTEESWAGEPVAAQAETLQAALDASLRGWLSDLKQEAERTD